MQMQAKDIFGERAALYALEESVWVKIGTGELTLTYNPYHPKELILKMIVDDTHDIFVYQIKPKVKSKGPMSWVLKGLNTKTKSEQILAARFAENYASEAFQRAVDGAIRNSRSHLQELSNISVPNEEQIKQLAQKPWRCDLCTTENGKDDPFCVICMTPRPFDHSRENSNSHSIGEPLPAISMTDASQLGLAGVGEGGHSAPTDEEAIYGSLTSPTKETIDFHLKEQPTADDPIQSSKKDFVRILNHIDSSLDDHTVGIKLYEDLRKLAKRLLRADNKYRVLDLRNPVVRSRLLEVEGVDAYLKYLGFEENKEKHKMICPLNQPAKSVIKAAIEVCEEFEERAKDYKATIEGMRGNTATADGTSAPANAGANATNQAGNIADTTASSDEKKVAKEEPEQEKEKDDYTIRQMIIQITNPDSRDDKTQDVLLLCHKPYCNSIDLLRTMIERFGEAGEEWQIKLKIGNMLRQWIRNFYGDDFEGEGECLDTLEAFLAESKKSEDQKVQKLAKTIAQSLEQQEKEYEKLEAMKERQPRRNLVVQMGVSAKFKFSEADPRVVAEQISLMDFRIFKSILKRECLGQAWKKKDREKKAPNVLAMIDQFNKVSKWIQVLILTASSLRERTKILKKSVEVAGHLLEMRNFSSCCAVKVALMSNPIHRLKACWSTLSKKHEEAFTEIQQIFDAAHNWTELRKLHREAPTPAILHIGVLLQDIVFIDEGNVERKDGIINFSRLMRLYEKIETLAMYQQEAYAFKEDTIIQQVLEEDFKSQEKLDDERLWQFSSDVKEKDNKALGWKDQ